ncbi:UNVERIFIED_CONTAM: hypothetical protein FKN15_064333 [Acipenser sinensis]
MLGYTDLEQTVMGIFVIRKEGAAACEPPEDVSIVIECVEVINDLSSVANACALLIGLIYCMHSIEPSRRS